MAIAYPSKMKVFFETPEGLVHEITGFVNSISFQYEGSGMVRTELEVLGYHPVAFSSQDFYAKIEEAKDKGEWKCDYCGHINPMSARNCGGDDNSSVGCGAARSFIYGNGNKY